LWCPAAEENDGHRSGRLQWPKKPAGNFSPTAVCPLPTHGRQGVTLDCFAARRPIRIDRVAEMMVNSGNLDAKLVPCWPGIAANCGVDPDRSA
jgi:hypothetical protein